VELFEAIRRDARREELSVRALADRHGVHRRTVRAALASATPPPRKPRRSPAPKLDPAKPFIDAMLREDLTDPASNGTPPGGCWPVWSMSTSWVS